MSGYLLDTTVLIDFSKGQRAVVQRVLKLIIDGERVGIASISLTEFYTGIDVGTDPRMDTFLDQLPCWPITQAVALTAARYRRRHRSLGRTIGAPDAMIAAVAKHQSAVVLTANVKDYPTDDVRVEWLGPEIG
ncbi:MAG: PIN domain-containing protein [Ardenticatenales bacterium]|nr:PIN domain-containing protein [Ardenticatenales bacterium]